MEFKARVKIYKLYKVRDYRQGEEDCTRPSARSRSTLAPSDTRLSACRLHDHIRFEPIVHAINDSEDNELPSVWMLEITVFIMRSKLGR